MFESLRPGAQVEHFCLAVLVIALIGTAGLCLLAIAHWPSCSWLVLSSGHRPESALEPKYHT